MNAKRIVVCSALAASLLCGAALPAPLEGVTWVAQPEPGLSILELRFGDVVPPFEVRVVPAGIAVRLNGDFPTMDPPEDVEIRAADGIADLLIRRPGSAINGTRVLDGALRISLTAGIPTGGSSDYRLGIGDVVTISVYQDRDLSGEYPVGQDGMVNLPLIGPVQAEGATDGELLATVRARLGEFLVDPHVSVSISAYESQFVYVISPSSGVSTKVTMSPGTSLTDVLAEASVALRPGQEVTLSRQPVGGEATSIRMSGADLERRQAPSLQAGDVLTVHPPDYVFVRGEVQQPDRLLYTPGLTLQQAITMVGGLTDWASRNDIRVLRQVSDGQEELKVNLKRIESGKDPDPKLQSGDLVIVRRRAF